MYLTARYNFKIVMGMFLTHTGRICQKCGKIRKIEKNMKIQNFQIFYSKLLHKWLEAPEILKNGIDDNFHKEKYGI